MCFQCQALFAQILDDSSRQVYSIRTVFVRQEREMASGKGKISPDTLLSGFSEKLDFLRNNGLDYQNLGTFGSASRPLYYQLPAEIGKRNGMQAFDALVPEKSEVTYFTTLSPFTSIRYMQGARQRSMLQTTFSVNPLSRLNLSAHYQRLTALRVVNVTSSDERENDHHSAWISSHYQSRSGNYRVWAHYRHLNHLQFLTGGAREGGAGFSDSLFQSPEIIRARLFKDARIRDLRNSWYASQVLKNQSGWFLRTIHSREKQVHRYGDARPDSLYYGKNNFFFQAEGPEGGEPDSLFVQRTYEVLENTIALGRQDSVADFKLYFRRRDWTLKNDFLPGSRKGKDNILGVSLHRGWRQWNLKASAEALSREEFDFRTFLSWKGLCMNARLISFRPTLVQDDFQSKNLSYTGNFSSSQALQLKLEKEFRMGGISLRPRIEATNVQNGIAFDSAFRPFQAIGTSEIRCLGIDVETSLLNRLHSLTRFNRTIQHGSRISGMPGYSIFTRHWFDLVKNRKAYAVQIGFSLDWRTDWTAEMFNGLNGQWYIQPKRSVPAYFMMNSFVHLRIERVRVYARVHNTLQGLGSEGYLATPLFPAQRRLFEIGLDWTFFD